MSQFQFEPTGKTAQTCVKVCEKTYDTRQATEPKLSNLKRAIFLDYQHHFIVGQCARGPPGSDPGAGDPAVVSGAAQPAVGGGGVSNGCERA